MSAEESEIKVKLLVHMEVVSPDDPTEAKFVFWASSPEAPGFYAAADHLKELFQLSEDALTDLFGSTPTIDPQIAETESSEGPPVDYQQNIDGVALGYVDRIQAASDSMSRTLALAVV
jgi:predicted RNase H-like HicB family nuclease